MPSSVRRSHSRRRRSSRRHTKYHKLAFRNKLGSILEAPSEAEEDHSEYLDGSRSISRTTSATLSSDSSCGSETSIRKDASSRNNASSRSNTSWRSIAAPRRGPKSERHRLVHEAKVEIVCELARTHGDASSVSIHRNLHKLAVNHDPDSFDLRAIPKAPVSEFEVCGPNATRLEGTWMSLSKPNFTGGLGTNENGDYMYTLGRMAFDMFQPTELICSIQGTFNTIKVVDRNDEQALKNVPDSLKADARYGEVPVRTYDIVTAFTIEPGREGAAGPNKGIDEPIEGTMTTYGYCLPYPTGNRLSVWFTGGCIEVGCDIDRWEEVFDKKNLPGRTLGQKGMLFVAKLLMGAETCDDMDENGKISYKLKRPLPANIDLAYIDGLTRIMRGKSGTVYVFRRVQDVEDVSSDEDEHHPLAQRDWGDSATISKRSLPTRTPSATRIPKRDWGDSAPVSKQSLPSRTPSAMRAPSRSFSPPLDNHEEDTPSMCPIPPSRSSSPAVDDDSDAASLCPKPPTRSRSPALDDDEDNTSLCPRMPTRSCSPASEDDGDTSSLCPRQPTRSSSPVADDDDTASLCPRQPTRSSSPALDDLDDNTSLCPRMPTRSCSPASEDDDDMSSLCPRQPTRSSSPVADDDDTASVCPRQPTRSFSPALDGDNDTASLCPRQPARCCSPAAEDDDDDTSSLCPRQPTRSSSPVVDNDETASLCPKPPTRSSSPASDGDDDKSSFCPRPPTRSWSPEAEEEEGSKNGESDLPSRLENTNTSCGLAKATSRQRRRSSRRMSGAPIAHKRNTRCQHRSSICLDGRERSEDFSMRQPTRSCSPANTSDDAPVSGIIRPIARRCYSYAPLAPHQPMRSQSPSSAGSSGNGFRRPTRSCSPTNSPVSDKRQSATRKGGSNASLAPQRPMRSRSPSGVASGSSLGPECPIRNSSPATVHAAPEASLRATCNSTNSLVQPPPSKIPKRTKSPKTTTCIGTADSRPRRPRRSITIPSSEDDCPVDATELSKPRQRVPSMISCDRGFPSLDCSERSDFMGESSRRLLAPTAA